MANNDTLTRQEQEILEQIDLLRKERELLSKLSEIRGSMEGAVQINKIVSTNNVSGKQTLPKAVGISKGDATWEKYVITVLNELGGKRKAQEIRVYARKANPGLEGSLIENAITNKISLLYRDGRISADESENKKDGYYYYLTDEQKKAANL